MLRLRLSLRKAQHVNGPLRASRCRRAQRRWYSGGSERLASNTKPPSSTRLTKASQHTHEEISAETLLTYEYTTSLNVVLCTPGPLKLSLAPYLPVDYLISVLASSFEVTVPEYCPELGVILHETRIFVVIPSDLYVRSYSTYVLTKLGSREC